MLPWRAPVHTRLAGRTHLVSCTARTVRFARAPAPVRRHTLRKTHTQPQPRKVEAQKCPLLTPCGHMPPKGRREEVATLGGRGRWREGGEGSVVL